MRVVVRADASSSIGIGHLMRTLALAQVLRDAGDEVVLLTTPGAGTLVERWKGEGAAVVMLDAPIGSRADARATRAAVRSRGASWLVLDGYDFDEAYRAAVRGLGRLLVVDDHGAAGLNADLVTNGNLYASDALYPATAARLLAGPRYAMLRREFRLHSLAAPPRDLILVSLGGADPRRWTEPLLVALAHRGIRGRVVVGPRQPAAHAVRRRAAELGWEVIDAPASMPSLMRSATLAVVGAGTAALELVAVGTPMVAVRIAENQAPVADALERLGLAVVVAGDAPDAAADAVAALAADEARRASMARLGHGMIDAHGASRVAAAMREEVLRLRAAAMADADLLLAWRNDPVTRAASFNRELTSSTDHLAWLHRALNDEGRSLLIGDVEGRPVGVVRLDRRGERAVISVTVAPSARGIGLATPLIRGGLRHAAALGISRLDAHIRPQNEASRRAFAAAGFVTDGGVPAAESGDAVIMVASPGRRR